MDVDVLRGADARPAPDRRGARGGARRARRRRRLRRRRLRRQHQPRHRRRPRRRRARRRGARPLAARRRRLRGRRAGRAVGARTCSTASSAATRSPSTRTSGSSRRSTAARSSTATRCRRGAPTPRRPSTWTRCRRCATGTRRTSPSTSRGAPAACRSGSRWRRTARAPTARRSSRRCAVARGRRREIAAREELELIREPDLSVVALRRARLGGRRLRGVVGEAAAPTRSASWCRPRVDGEPATRIAIVNPRTTLDDIRHHPGLAAGLPAPAVLSAPPARSTAGASTSAPEDPDHAADAVAGARADLLHQRPGDGERRDERDVGDRLHGGEDAAAHGVGRAPLHDALARDVLDAVARRRRRPRRRGSARTTGSTAQIAEARRGHERARSAAPSAR